MDDFIKGTICANKFEQIMLSEDQKSDGKKIPAKHLHIWVTLNQMSEVFIKTKSKPDKGEHLVGALEQLPETHSLVFNKSAKKQNPHHQGSSPAHPKHTKQTFKDEFTVAIDDTDQKNFNSRICEVVWLKPHPQTTNPQTQNATFLSMESKWGMSHLACWFP